MKKHGYKKAFTIVELVIVIAVISILSAILIPTFSDIVNQAQGSAIKQEARNAYNEYFINHAADGINYNNFIYYTEDGKIIALKQGEPINEIFTSENAAIVSLVGSTSQHTVKGTLDGNLFAVIPTNEVKESKWSEATAVFVGDSITQGVGTDSNNIYHVYLKEMLGLDIAINKGIAGSCISVKSDYGTKNTPLINRYQSIPDADLIVIFMGTNDYGHHTPLGTIEDSSDNSFYGALNVIIPGIQASHPNSQLVVVTPLHRYGFNGATYDTVKNNAGHTLEDYVNALKNVCEKFSVSVIDLFNEFPLNPEFENIRKTYMKDGLHPNAEGHKLIARIICAQLEWIERKNNSITNPDNSTENTDFTLSHGNRFGGTSYESDTKRACTVQNIYLKSGTTVIIKENSNFNWAVTKENSEISTSVGNYYFSNGWDEAGCRVITEDGWYGFTIMKTSNEKFDFNGGDSKDLLDYFIITQNFDMQVGNRFINSIDETRMSSKINLYLTAGTTITFDSASEATDWALSQTSTATTSEQNYKTSGWTTSVTYTVEEDGYYGFTVKNDSGFNYSADKYDLFDFFGIPFPQ